MPQDLQWSGSAGHERGPSRPKRPVACDRCHSQKIKCSGEQPCSRCRLAGQDDQCRYVFRDRKVRIEESYLEQLIKDSRELRKQRLAAHSNNAQTTSLAIDQPRVEETDFNVENPLLTDRARFYPQGALELPRYVSEASSAAFATRLSQCFRGKECSSPDPPQVRHVDDSSLVRLLHTDTPLPYPAQARLLVKTALSHTNPPFHLALRTDSLNQLHDNYRGTICEDSASTCKYLALFALGELYSMLPIMSKSCSIPGSSYYVRAMGLLSIFPERPNIKHIEALLILALYSQFLNRWQSAFALVGHALRAALGCGLNHDISENQCTNLIEREHRVRIWWTIFIFDRFWSCKHGFPVQIQDEDIHVSMPSNLPVGSYNEQFADCSYQVAAIELAWISGRTIRSIYTPNIRSESFLNRERKLLFDLKQWIRALPDQVRLRSGYPNPRYVTVLHLQFNYCVVLATRPVLLHVLHLVAKAEDSAVISITPVLTTLGEACIRAARHTLELCVEEWTGGCSSVFGYAFAQYVFTSGLVLIVSSLVPFGKKSDLSFVETSMEMLRSLCMNGNLVAIDLFEHLQLVQQDLKGWRSASNPVLARSSGCMQPTIPSALNDGSDSVSGNQTDVTSQSTSLSSTKCDNNTIVESEPHMTTEMALQQPFMQDFLAYSDDYLTLLNSTGESLDAYAMSWTAFPP